jgi:hypothetical protein
LANVLSVLGPDLNYSGEMKVLCVYTGQEMVDYRKWNFKQFAASARALKLS